MKRNIVNFYLVVAFFCLGLFGCEKTVEGELSAWERNVSKVNLLVGKYPQFKAHLVHIQAEAEKQKEEALKIASKEEQIKALAKANSALRNQFVQDIEKIAPAMEEIQVQLREIESSFKDEDYSKEIYRLIVEAENGMKEAQQAIDKAEGDFNTVQGIVRVQYEQLSRYESKLMDIIDEKQEADTKKAELSKENQQVDTNGESQKEVKQAVKCSHCGSSNQDAAGKCSSCGANLKS